MLQGKKFIITIGDHGTIVALHSKNDISRKIFIQALDEKSQSEIIEIFNENKSCPIYILLDNLDQSYKKKLYPLVKRIDLPRIIKRDLLGNKDPLKSYMILDKVNDTKESKNKKWECLFVSSSISDKIDKWLQFLPTLQNNLLGIYMLPIEAFNLHKKLASKKKSNTEKVRNKLTCLILQNKISGTRQIVFSDKGVVFTRVVSYELEDPSFIEKYEQDIYSTFEYLKRMYHDLKIGDISIMNIMPSNTQEILKKITNTELKITNYTPYDIANKIGFQEYISPKSKSCDLLMSRIFYKEKNILKFTTPNISSIIKYFYILKASHFLSTLLIIGIIGIVGFNIFSQNSIKNEFKKLQNKKISSERKLESAKSLAFDDSIDEKEAEKIVDLGKLNDSLGQLENKHYDLYVNLSFLRNYNVELNSYNYSIKGFRPLYPSPNLKYNFSYDGVLTNETGDIENLFTQFDVLVAETKKNIENHSMTYSQLPKDIDFNQKYYNFPIKFDITSK